MGGLRAAYAWLVEEEQELEKSLLSGLKPPKVPDEPLELVDDDVLRRLLGACEDATSRPGEIQHSPRSSSIPGLVEVRSPSQIECRLP